MGERVEKLADHRSTERRITPEEIEVISTKLTRLVDTAFSAASDIPDRRFMKEVIKQMKNNEDRRKAIVDAVCKLRDIAKDMLSKEHSPQGRFAASMYGLAEILNNSSMESASLDTYLSILNERLSTIEWFVSRQDGHTGATRPRREWPES